MQTHSPTRAAGTLRVLHWLMAFAVIAAWSFIYSKGWFERGTPTRSFLSAAHIFAGLSVGWLILPRLIVRLRNPMPAIQPATPNWQEAIAKVAHLALYTALLVLPLLGVLFMQSSGREVSYFGWALPTLVGQDKALSHTLKEIHETVGLLLLYLVIAHAAAALWHHFVKRDNTLKRML